MCLQILINITYDSPNTSIYLSGRQGFVSVLMALIGQDAYSNDATWLLAHICADGMIDLSVFHKATVFSIFAQKLQQGVLDL